MCWCVCVRVLVLVRVLVRALVGVLDPKLASYFLLCLCQCVHFCVCWYG